MTVVCETCDDTHWMPFGDGTMLCTRCPVPCHRCRAGGNGPYCATTPCACGCHLQDVAPACPVGSHECAIRRVCTNACGRLDSAATSRSAGWRPYEPSREAERTAHHERKMAEHIAACDFQCDVCGAAPFTECALDCAEHPRNCTEWDWPSAVEPACTECGDPLTSARRLLGTGLCGPCTVEININLEAASHG